MENKICNIAAEQLVLGTILVDYKKFEETNEILNASMFYDEFNSQIYSYMSQLYKENKIIDVVTIYEISGKSININNLTKLSTASVAYKLEEHCDIIKEKSKLRFVRDGLIESLKMLDSGDNIENVLSVQNEIIIKVDSNDKNDGLFTMSDVLASTMDQIDYNFRNKGKLTGLDTGMTDVNKLMNGLQKQDLIFIAARPAMGKTAFVTNICKNAALKPNDDKSMNVIDFFSLEMSKEKLAMRILSCDANIEMEKIKTGDLNEKEFNELYNVCNALALTKMNFCDSFNININFIRRECRKTMRREKRLDLIVIDYLQLMESTGKSDNRQQEVSKMSRQLKLLAKEFNCPVIALSQLSRGPEQRQDHRPMLSDLRDSGSIEQDADVVLFLYRDEYYNPESEKKGIVECIAAKNRNGECKTVELACMLEYQKIANLAR